MDTRELKGLEIAAISKVSRKNGIWYVPSQTGDGTRYKVDLKEERRYYQPIASCSLSQA